MKSSQIAIAALLLCAGLGLRARGDAIDDSIKSEMARRRIPGLAVAVIRDGQPLKAAGYGVADVEKADPVTPSTVFDVGAVAETFTAATVLTLIECGKIGIDDPVSRFFATAPRQWRAITVRHLLTNTSGIKDYRTEFRGMTGVELTPEFIYQKAIGAGLNFTPGTQFRDSATNYVLLGMIVAATSGRPFYQTISAGLLKPLGMTHTTAVTAQRAGPDRTTGYKIAEASVAPAESESHGFGDAFLSSSLDDLVKWAAALDTGGLLAEEVRNAMWKPAALAPPGKSTAETESRPKTAPYGMAWHIDTLNGHRVLWSGSSAGGFSACLARFPADHLSVILLTNLGDVNVLPLVRGVAAGFVPALK